MKLILRIIDELTLLGGFLLSIIFRSKSFLALLLVFGVVFGTVLAFQTSRTIDNLNNTHSSFTSSISNLEQILGNINNFDNVKDQINRDLEPVTNLVGISSLTRNDINRTTELLKKWLTAIKPLTDYKFSKNGLESTISSIRFFSNDLVDFFRILPELNKETQNLLNSLFLYKFIPISALQNILNLASNFLETMTKIQDNKEEILSLLGHYQTQRIAIFNQSPGEARPTGGFLGSYIPIDITQGKVNILGTQSIYGIDEGSKSRFVAHPATWYYGYGLRESTFHGIRNSNFFSCLETSSSIINSQFQAQQEGYLLNSIIFLSPKVILDFLPDNFSFIAKDKTITKANFLNEIEIESGVKFTDGNNPKKEIDSFIKPLLENLPTIITSQKSSKLLNSLENSLRTRSLGIWFDNPKVQNLWRSTGLSGTNTCQNYNPNSITPIIANISGDKRNLYTTHNYLLERSQNKINIKYSQKTPPDIETKLIREYRANQSFGMVGIQIPRNTKNWNVTSDNSYNLPFLRKYYVLQTKELVNKEPYIVGELKQVINSGVDLGGNFDSNQNIEQNKNKDNSKDNSKPKQGFIYDNPDGSKVLGIYVDETGNFEVEFEFELDNNNSWLDNLQFWRNQKLEFTGQVGMNQTIETKNKIITDPSEALGSTEF